MKAVIHKFRQRVAQKRLRGVEFSIISNNCWGAHVYQTIGRAYTTPFVGLFVSPVSYLRLLAEFPRCLSLPLKFKTASAEAYVNEARAAHSIQWPIGCLGDGVEIQFMHYKSEAEAGEKWKRRVARFSPQPGKWFFKFCDRDGCTPEQTVAFDQLPFPNKVFFTTQRDGSSRCGVKIQLKGPCVPDGLSLSRLSPAYFDTADWLAGGSGRVRWWGSYLNCV